MKIKLFLLFITSLSLISIAKANVIYRHVPFSLAITNADKVIVDYDFTGHRGIVCQSDDGKFLANFVYKGHQKSADLPVVLQNSLVPTKDGEELADVSGQFNLISNDDTDETNLNCEFVD